MSPATAVLDRDLNRPAASERLALAVRPVGGWAVEAACRRVDTSGGNDPFYSADGESHPETRGRQQRAKRICGRCPVRRACLRHALDTGEPHGIWGGLTEH